MVISNHNFFFQGSNFRFHIVFVGLCTSFFGSGETEHKLIMTPKRLKPFKGVAFLDHAVINIKVSQMILMGLPCEYGFLETDVNRMYHPKT